MTNPNTEAEAVSRQVLMLRRQCMWQRAKFTSRDNGYPYHKHLPDCDICRSADLIDALQSRVRELEGAVEATIEDLRIRAETGRNGELVVNLSASVWDKLNEAAGGQTE